MSEALPKGWISVKFTDILGINGGSQPPKNDFIYEDRKGYVRLLQIRDFGEKPFPTYVPLSRKLRLVKKDELLLARYGGTSSDDSLGRVCTGMEGAYNVALVKLIFFKDLTPTSFIKHLLGAHFFLDVISKNSRSCQTGFNKGDLDDVSFPLPPLNEQKRIVAKLDKIIPRIDAVKERLNKVPAIIKRFRQSVLTAACSGRLTESIEEYPVVQFCDLIKCIRGGTTAVPTNDLTNFPVLRSSSVRQGYVDYKDVKYLTQYQSTNTDNFIANGDLLFTRLNGTAEYVGNCALVSGIQSNKYQYPDRLYCTRLTNKILSAYCVVAFSLPEIRIEISNVRLSNCICVS